VTYKVIQGHWQWCHSTGHIRFSISLKLQLCLYILHRQRDIITYFPKCKESRDSENIPLGSNIPRMHSNSYASIST